MSFYSKMAGVATKLITKFQQGTAAYVEKSVTGDAWDPTAGAEVVTPIVVTVSGVSQEYVDGKLVVASDLQVTAAVFGKVPSVYGKIRLDGEDLQIVKVVAVPAAGEVVAWKIVVRA